MKTSMLSFAVCGALVLGACSGSDADLEADEPATETSETAGDASAPVGTDASAPTTTPPFVSDPEALAKCPSVEVVSAAAGVTLTEPAAVDNAQDMVGSDPTTGSTGCAYRLPDGAQFVVTLHGSPIDTSFFESLPAEMAEVTQLASGATQLEFVGQNNCEVYDGQLSVITFSQSTDTDACSVVSNVLEALQEG